MTTAIDVLLVEDNPGDADFIRAIMNRDYSVRYHFAHVERLSEGIRHLMANKAHLVLLDLGLPDSSGLDTIRRFHEAVPHIPVVVLTGNDDQAAGVAAVKAGAQDYLVKGKVTADLLARVFEYAVERHQHQESLRASEHFLRSTLDALSAHIAILASDGAILAANRAWCEFAVVNGAQRTDGYIGTNYLGVCDRAANEGDRAAAVFGAGIRAVIDGVREIFEMEYPCHGPDRQHWFHGRVTVFLAEGERRVVVGHENITNRKLAENALALSEKRLRLVLDTSPNCVFIKNRSGRFLLVNQAVADLYGIAMPAMIGKTAQEISANGFPDRGNAGPALSGAAPLNASASPLYNRDEPFTLADGSVRWFSIIQRAIDFPGDPGCTLSIAVDVTDQRKAQEELRNSELRLRAILDAQTSMVVHLDPHMRVLWPNREACRVPGLTRQEIIGRPCYEIWQKRSDVCEKCPVAAAIRDGRTFAERLTNPDGHIWRVHGCPVWDDTGSIVSAVLVAEDITERLSLENQLRQAQKMESLGTLAGGIAHDFNNILSAILGYTELAMEKTAGLPDLRSDLQEAYQAGLRATDLVRQILTFSRRTDTTLKPLQIGLIVKEALKLLRSTLPTSIEIRQRIGKGLDPVLADPTQIHQIVMNLCTNASHAMEPSGGILEVGLEPFEIAAEMVHRVPGLSPGSYLKLTVGDTGCGMTPEIIASIFDPYFTTKNLGEGTGLGLSVVHGIVNEYGGDIAVESIPGKGSTFTLFFPVVKDGAIDSEQAGLDFLPGGTERILVVDDEPAVLNVICQILERQGYHVAPENDSPRALERFRHDPGAFDLVLSDMTMPKMTGDRLAVEVLAIRPDIPVILCTGYSRLITEQAATSIGIRALLPKPVVKKILLSEVRRVLNESGV
jgi:PAS domain S-box-containing protein